MSISLEIITPMGTALSMEAEYVYVPARQGEIGILAGHESLIATLIPGELRCKTPNKEEEEYLVVSGGLLQVVDDKVTVVTDLAVNDAQIDETSVEKAIEAAKAELKARGNVSLEELARFEASLTKQIAALKFRKKRK